MDEYWKSSSIRELPSLVLQVRVVIAAILAMEIFGSFHRPPIPQIGGHHLVKERNIAQR